MPRGKKTEAAVKETQVSRTVAPKQLTALVKAHNENHKKRQSLQGEIGQRVKEAVENGHLNRKAYSIMCALDRMDEDTRLDVIRSLQLYIDIMDEQVWKLGSHVGDLADQAEESPDDGSSEDVDVRPQFLKDQEAARAKENAERIRAGIKQLPEGDAPGSYKMN